MDFLQQVDASATVSDLKQELFALEGIPVGQQVLCYAGQDLKNHLTLEDHALDQYTLSDEVVLYLSKKRANPKIIYLLARSRPHQKVPELVEADMPVGEAMALLESRGLSTAFAPGSSIYCKRQDGSTVPLHVNASLTLAGLEEKILQQEGVAIESLTFTQAQDGQLHVVLWRSAESSNDTYPVYCRNVRPQPVMPKKDAATGQPFQELVDELCVMP